MKKSFIPSVFVCSAFVIILLFRRFAPFVQRRPSLSSCFLFLVFFLFSQGVRESAGLRVDVFMDRLDSFRCCVWSTGFQPEPENGLAKNQAPLHLHTLSYSLCVSLLKLSFEF